MLPKIKEEKESSIKIVTVHEGDTKNPDSPGVRNETRKRKVK